MFKIFYEDIDVGQTETFGQYEVTKEEVIEFASKYDPQPFHLDEEFAKQTHFGALCASGWHTCSMMMRMMVDHLTEKGVASLGSPGLEGVEWKKPVYPGDILRVTTEITAKRESKSRPGLGLLSATYTVTNQRDEVVMTVRSTYMMARRSS